MPVVASHFSSSIKPSSYSNYSSSSSSKYSSPSSTIGKSYSYRTSSLERIQPSTYSSSLSSSHSISRTTPSYSTSLNSSNFSSGYTTYSSRYPTISRPPRPSIERKSTYQFDNLSTRKERLASDCLLLLQLPVIVIRVLRWNRLLQLVRMQVHLIIGGIEI
jgi:hypothetical protein